VDIQILLFIVCKEESSAKGKSTAKVCAS
jgi:hypothetical protein